jgi:hypothetical protein
MKPAGGPSSGATKNFSLIPLARQSIGASHQTGWTGWSAPSFFFSAMSISSVGLAAIRPGRAGKVDRRVTYGRLDTLSKPFSD